jgi:hypothetical protein
VRREKAALSSGCKPHPAGNRCQPESNLSSYGGNEVAAPTAKGCEYRDVAMPRLSGVPSAPDLLRTRSEHEQTRVTSVELFFDLVFVFAVTQLSHLLLAHLDFAGAIQTALLLMAVWWVWVYTSWVTDWLDPERLPYGSSCLQDDCGCPRRGNSRQHRDVVALFQHRR